MRDKLIPLHGKDFTKEQRNNILESHLFLKEKRDSTLNVRTVAVSNKQRDFISREDASSPTVITESFIITCIVDVE